MHRAIWWVVALAVISVVPASAQITWQTDYDKALALAKKSRKPVLQWCTAFG